MSSITAIITTYRRPNNIAPLVAAIRKQSVPATVIWAWANDPSDKMKVLLVGAKLDRVVTSSQNAFFHGRFALALLAQTEFVAIFDDDSIPGENWFANCLETMEQTPGILGTAGVVLHGEANGTSRPPPQPFPEGRGSYSPPQHQLSAGERGGCISADYAKRTMHGWQRPSDETVEVDLVGQAWFLRTEWVKYLFSCPPVTGKNGEDIELAARAWRLAQIRSFCPPHPANDQSCWGSTRGLELGLDDTAASLRVEHLSERRRVVEAEMAAGWRPLFMRKEGSGFGVQGSGDVEQRGYPQTGAAVVGNASGNKQAQQHGGQCPPYDLGDALERQRDPLEFLRGLRQKYPRIVGSVANVRREDVIRGLIGGRWVGSGFGVQGSARECVGNALRRVPASPPLRYFTRRELEKLFYRAGFSVVLRGNREDELPSPSSNGDGLPRRKRRHGPHPSPPPEGEGVIPFFAAGFTADEVEELNTERYQFEAVAGETRDFGLTSIIIVTHNQVGYTRSCLESIRFVTDEPYELIVVDNGSTDGTIAYLRNCADVKLIANAENRGFPAAVNQGIAASAGQQVLLLNNDVIVTTGWLRRMLDALKGSGGAEGAPVQGSKQENPESKIENPKSRIGLVGPLTNNASGHQEFVPGYRDLACLDGFAWEHGKANAGQVQEVDRLIGFCVLIRREVVDQVGLFDERFGIGNFEDDDYCRRARAAGWRLVVARNAYIHHFGHRSFEAAGVDLNALLEKNKRLYEEKWAEEGTGNREQVTGNGNPCSLSPVPCSLSLCMIVRDNERTIRACLQSIRPWVDEMVVVDTGSTDATPEICRELGAQVYHFPWPDSFAVARNESLKYARGEWIFWMDSDDVIDAANGRKLRELVNSLPRAAASKSATDNGQRTTDQADNPKSKIENPKSPDVLGFVMQVHCPGGGDDGAHDITVVDHVKLFRNRFDLRFEGRIHEQVLEAINRAGGQIIFTDIFVVHAGADHSPEGRRRKLRRDIKLLTLDRRERPDHPFVHFNLGMTYSDAGKHRKAVRALGRSLELAQPHESHVRKIYALLIASHHELGERAEARQAAAEGLKLFPKDPELLFRNAMLLHEDGRLRAAELSYLAALANNDELHFASIDRGIVGFKARQNLAAVYSDMGALHKAEAQWRRIVADVPGYRAGWRGLFDSLVAQGRLNDAARAAAEISAAGSPLRGLGLTLAALAAEAAGQVCTAEQMLRQAQRECPEDVAPLDELCRLLFYRGDVKEVEGLLRELVRLQPANAAALHNLGTVLARVGEHASAAKSFRASLQHRPDSQLTCLSLGYALCSAGLLGEASAAFERCIELAPHAPLAAEAQRQLAVTAA